MKVLVTGGAGFVGRATVAALHARGDDVRALLPARASHLAVVRARFERAGVRTVDGDVDDEKALVAAARGVDVVVHAAEHAPTGCSLADHERANLIGTENALAACQRAGVRRMVHLSSEAVTAGDYPRSFVDESFPQPDAFLSPYARTKALAEDLVLGANGMKSLETVALRPGWLWGPDDDRLLPDLLRRRRARTLTLVSGGQAFVPSAYIANVVAAVLLAASAAAAPGNVYYVTDDERVTCRAFFARLLAAVGQGVPKKSLPYRVAYAHAWWCEKTQREPVWTRAEVVRLGQPAMFNVKRARDDLGYAPAVSVADGAKLLAAWVAAVGGADAVARGDVLELPPPAPEAAPVDG